MQSMPRNNFNNTIILTSLLLILIGLVLTACGETNVTTSITLSLSLTSPVAVTKEASVTSISNASTTPTANSNSSSSSNSNNSSQANNPTVAPATPKPRSILRYYQTKEALQVIQEAGLAISSAKPLEARDFATVQSNLSLQFLLPDSSVGGAGNANELGTILAFANEVDLNRAYQYYDEITRYAPANFRWLIVVENLVVTLSGKLEPRYAKQFEKALAKLGTVTANQPNLPPIDHNNRDAAKFKDVPALSEFDEINLPLVYYDYAMKAYDVPNMGYRAYSSIEKPSKVAARLNKIFSDAGYSIIRPFEPVNTSYIATFTKVGTVDVIIIIDEVSVLLENYKSDGPSNEWMMRQISDKTSIIQVFVGKNLNKAVKQK